MLRKDEDNLEFQVLLAEYNQGKEDLRLRYRHYPIILTFYATGLAAI